VELFFSKLFCQVDYDYGVKGAFLDADSAASAQVFGYHSLAILRPLDYAFAAGFVHWAVDDAL
jgi:hypothetical protein